MARKKKNREEKMEKMEEYGERVTLCPDGKYRWMYELHLLKNPTVLFDVWKVLAITLVIVAVLMFTILILAGDFEWQLVTGMMSVLGIVILIMAVLSIVGYVFYAAITGWKYAVLFVMDDKEVVHKQMPKTVRKAEMIGKVAMVVGALAGKPGVAGAGMLSASRTTMTTELAHVRRVIPRRWMHVIKVNQLLSKNRVYVRDEDFDFVYSFLREHCINTK